MMINKNKVKNLRKVLSLIKLFEALIWFYMNLQELYSYTMNPKGGGILHSLNI